MWMHFFPPFFNLLHAGVNLQTTSKFVKTSLKKKLKIKFLLPYLDSAWKMHSNEYKKVHFLFNNPWNSLTFRETFVKFEAFYDNTLVWNWQWAADRKEQ